MSKRKTICSNCSTSNPPDAVFCVECGTKIREAVEETEPPSVGALSGKRIKPMNQNEPSLRIISGIIAFIAILADVIAVIVFLRDVFFGGPPFAFSSALTRTLVIVLAFTFAVLLFSYSRQQLKQLDGVFICFGWVYVVLSALLFGGISYLSLLKSQYGLGEYLGYILLVILIAGLGTTISKMTNNAITYFSVPFMLVALEQIALWIVLIFGDQAIAFNWAFIGNILLFVIAGGFILFFITGGLGSEGVLGTSVSRKIGVATVGVLIFVIVVVGLFLLIQTSPLLGIVAFVLVVGLMGLGIVLATRNADI